MTKQETEKYIEHLEMAGNNLLQQAKDLRSGKDSRICKHGEYTRELFNTRGCKTCGSPKVVICSHEKVIGKKRNNKLCNSHSCKYFELTN